jgi:hypothetical protein
MPIVIIMRRIPSISQVFALIITVIIKAIFWLLFRCDWMAGEASPRNMPLWEYVFRASTNLHLYNSPYWRCLFNTLCKVTLWVSLGLHSKDPLKCYIDSFEWRKRLSQLEASIFPQHLHDHSVSRCYCISFLSCQFQNDISVHSRLSELPSSYVSPNLIYLPVSIDLICTEHDFGDFFGENSGCKH